MLIDLSEIKRLAVEYEDSNWRFRTYLKGVDMSVEEIDTVFHEANERIAPAIDCTACANCCKEKSPVLRPADIQRLADHLNKTPAEVTSQYLARDSSDGDPDEWMFASLPCPFLANNLCTVYDHRPDDCRSYPHLHQPERVFSLASILDNCSVCPIVFNVFEEVKQEIKSRPDPGLY